MRKCHNEERLTQSHTRVFAFALLFFLSGVLSVCSPLLSLSWAQLRLEDPEASSHQSGIALIRGWACEATLIEIQIDDGPRLRAAYGTTRPDTQPVCGDENNGFGLTWNWNRSGAGLHRVRAYADDVLFGDVTFTVATFGEEFLTGRSGSCTVPNFPQVGNATVLEWQQTLQNFVIIGSNGGGGSVTDGNQRYLEDPSPASHQSGIALIRGWACEATLIEIQIDDGPRLRAAYGTTRPDTQPVCGDENNGFGLTWNWNRSGAGLHRVRAYADDVLFGDVTFTVATFGEEFLTGRSGSCTVPNFPQVGNATVLEWQQTLQNFVITAVDANPTDALVRQGVSALAAGNLQAANQAFAQAVDSDQNNERANFYYAVTRIPTTLLDNPQVATLVTLSGAVMAGASNEICGLHLTFPPMVAPGTPPTGEIFEFLRAVLTPALDAALVNLHRLSPAVNITVPLAMLPSCLRLGDERAAVEIDQGDILALIGSLQGVRALFEVGSAYNIDVDLQTALGSTAQQIFASAPSLLTLKSSPPLSTARGFTAQALTNLELALASILAETDDQFGDFLIVVPQDRAGAEQLQQTLNLVRQSLQGQVTLPTSIGLPAPERVNLNLFFSGNFSNLRPFLPAFDTEGNFALEQFPDPTFGGTAPDSTQEDLNHVIEFLRNIFRELW